MNCSYFQESQNRIEISLTQRFHVMMHRLERQRGNQSLIALMKLGVLSVRLISVKRPSFAFLKIIRIL